MSDSLGADYLRAGFGGRLGFGQSPALLLVDPVRAYVDPGSALHLASGQAIASMVRLANEAREAGFPIVFTRVVYSAGGEDGGVFFRKVPALKAFLPGSPLAGFPEELRPEPGDLVVTKQYASAFFGTSLASTLHALKIDTVVLGGFSTSGCVRASAVDALQNGFIPFVARDACADRDPAPHEANLFDLQAKYAEVVSADEVIALFRKTARVRTQLSQ